MHQVNNPFYTLTIRNFFQYYLLFVISKIFRSLSIWLFAIFSNSIVNEHKGLINRTFINLLHENVSFLYDFILNLFSIHIANKVEQNKHKKNNVLFHRISSSILCFFFVLIFICPFSFHQTNHHNSKMVLFPYSCNIFWCILTWLVGFRLLYILT